MIDTKNTNTNRAQRRTNLTPPFGNGGELYEFVAAAARANPQLKRVIACNSDCVANASCVDGRIWSWHEIYRNGVHRTAYGGFDDDSFQPFNDTEEFAKEMLLDDLPDWCTSLREVALFVGGEHIGPYPTKQGTLDDKWDGQKVYFDEEAQQ